MIGNTVQLFPNPAKDKINIDLNNSNIRSGEVSIHNMLGEVVLKSQLTNSGSMTTIDLVELDPGVYLLTLDTEYGNMTKKIVLN